MSGTPPETPLFHWRAHHIALCAHSYIGKGYTEAYSANINRMMATINASPAGVDVRIVDGPDDWCRPLLAATDEASKARQRHCHEKSTQARDQLALEDLGHVMGHPVKIGDIVRLDKELVLRIRKAFRQAAREKQASPDKLYPAPRRGCHACPWHALCDEVAQRYFRTTTLYPDAIPRALAAHATKTGANL